MTNKIDSFLSRHGQMLIWLVVTLVAIGVAYGDLRTDVDHVTSTQDTQAIVLQRQLESIDQRLQSIEQFLRSR